MVPSQRRPGHGSSRASRTQRPLELAPDERPTPEQLMTHVARGSEEAFTQLYDVLAPQVFGLVRQVVRDPTQTEEVVREVLVTVWQNATRFDAARCTVSTWVLTLAHRRAVDRVRAEQASTNREPRVAQLDNLQQDGDTYLDEVRPLSSPLGTMTTCIRNGLMRLRHCVGVASTKMDVHTSGGAYALNALPSDEQSGFERHLAGCEQCRGEVAGFQAVAARLGVALGTTPPPDLRDRVFAQVAATRQLPPLATASTHPVKIAVLARHLRWILTLDHQRADSAPRPRDGPAIRTKPGSWLGRRT